MTGLQGKTSWQIIPMHYQSYSRTIDASVRLAGDVEAPIRWSMGILIEEIAVSGMLVFARERKSSICMTAI